jgi:predicted pyridoxine 5'-phosphate oxidase superfamily flavin-nucleotide-binding protein
MTMAALHGWHPGEVAIQRKLGYADAVRDHWSIVGSFMPQQHRIFHTSNLPFIPVTTLDDDGRPWASIVSGSTGAIGFVKSPDARTLSIHARVWDGDPLLDTFRAWSSLKSREDAISDRFLTAGLGIEFSTRRRNKFAGFIRGMQQVTASDYQIDLAITETTG